MSMGRQNNLKTLIEEKFSGSQIDFSRRVGIQPAQVNQWLNGYRALGEKSARKIEQSLGLNKYWLDATDKQSDKTNIAVFDEDELRLLKLFRSIKNPKIKLEIIGYVLRASESQSEEQKKSKRNTATGPSQKKAA